MAKVKSFKKEIVTPKAVAQYPWLNRPDSRFGDPVYKVNLTFEGEVGQKLFDDIQAIAVEALEYQKGIDPAFKKIKELKLPISPAEDEDGNEIEGKWVMKIKSNAFITTGDKEVIEIKPTLVDALKQPFNGSIFGGSVIKCSLALVPYAGFGGGLTARLQAVQVLKAVQGSNGTDAFDVEDDYADDTTDDTTDTPTSTDDF